MEVIAGSDGKSVAKLKLAVNIPKVKGFTYDRLKGLIGLYNDF